MDIKQFIKKHHAEIAGWSGVALLQGATLPPMVSHIRHPEAGGLPPLTMVLMVWAGLLCYFYRAVVGRDKVYMVSNGIGLLLNAVLMAMIIFPAS
jgi:hypothetical protein